MLINHLKKSKWILLVALAPLLFLFQNCGSTKGYDSTGGNGSSSSTSQSRNSGYTPYGGGGGTSGSSGVFVGGNSGGSSSGSSSGGSTSGGSSSGGSGNSSGSSSGGSSGGTSGSSDGQNCYDDGPDNGYYGIEKSVWDLYNNTSNTHINILRAIPLKEKRLIYGDVGFQLQFPEARHGEAITFTCGFSFDKLKKYFPAQYTWGLGNYICDDDSSSNVTTYQCRHGEWHFAGSSCKCTYVNTTDR